jgi:hypothetical protein
VKTIISKKKNALFLTRQKQINHREHRVHKERISWVTAKTTPKHRVTQSNAEYGNFWVKTKPPTAAADLRMPIFNKTSKEIGIVPFYLPYMARGTEYRFSWVTTKT